MTLHDCYRGKRVVYRMRQRQPNGCETIHDEPGIVSSTNDTYVFVRFDAQNGATARACCPGDLYDPPA